MIQAPAGETPTSYFESFFSSSSTDQQAELQERPKSQRDLPPYLQGLDVSNVEDFVNKTHQRAKAFTNR